VLVVAMLIIPASTAYLLTDNFPIKLILSAVAGITASIAGYFLAAWIDGSIAGAMTTVLGLEFIFAFLFSPLNGVAFKKLL
jgi:manganese/zinc/iron transport system permease protein